MSVGHSNRSIDEFLDILRHARVALVLDVRSFPRSRSNTVFNIDTLPDDLAGDGIAYQHMPSLGGRRSIQPDVDHATNALWRVRGFHNYADYAFSETFSQGFSKLVELGQETRLAMMCSEAVWWRCHRRIITDYLLAGGHPVDHLMGAGRIQAAKMTPGAMVIDGNKVAYPAA